MSVVGGAAGEPGGRRARLRQTGWAEPLGIEPWFPRETPLGPREVLVELEACGVCHRDLLDREGRFPFLQLPVTPGHEAAGRVVDVGPEAADFKIGDRVATMHRDACGACPQCLAGESSLCASAAHVLGILADGGYATHLRAPQSALYRVEAKLTGPEAAVLHCTFGTAYRDLVTLGGLRRGERVLVTGANGGVGSAAVQIASRLGAEVIGVVRDERHRAFVVDQGAADVIVAAPGELHRDGKARSIDLALDTVGVSTFNGALRSLRVGGRMVIVGNIVSERAALNLGYLVTYGLRIIGGSGATRREMAELQQLHAAAPLRVPIDRVLPLDQAEAAQQAVRAGGLRGRVVVVPG
jgi:acryloyl-coenzyme A reductase